MGMRKEYLVSRQFWEKPIDVANHERRPINIFDVMLSAHLQETRELLPGDGEGYLLQRTTVGGLNYCSIDPNAYKIHGATRE